MVPPALGEEEERNGRPVGAGRPEDGCLRIRGVRVLGWVRGPAGGVFVLRRGGSYCASVQILVQKIGAGGGRVRSSQFAGGLTPQGSRVPPHESEICPPHPTQLPPGAGEGGTGRPGARRTLAKGRKVGGDEGGRKKLGGAMENPGVSLGGDWEGEEGGDADRRPVGRKARGWVRAVGGWLQGEGGWGPPTPGF